MPPFRVNVAVLNSGGCVKFRKRKKHPLPQKRKRICDQTKRRTLLLRNLMTVFQAKIKLKMNLERQLDSNGS
jgi:hypothetical protein